MKLQIRKFKYFLNENSNYQYLKAYKTFITLEISKYYLTK